MILPQLHDIRGASAKGYDIMSGASLISSDIKALVSDIRPVTSMTSTDIRVTVMISDPPLLVCMISDASCL